MNENLDLAGILRNCPEGTILYSTLCGEVKFKGTAGDVIVAYTAEYGDEIDFNKNGGFYGFDDGECILFPSKDNRDWSTFKVPNKLPKTWEEFCKIHPVRKGECYINTSSVIESFEEDCVYRDRYADKNMFPNKYSAGAMLAICQLIQLRDYYNDGWEPDWRDVYQNKYCIYWHSNNIVCDIRYDEQCVLSFKTAELRDEFLVNFKELIEIAKPLL